MAVMVEFEFDGHRWLAHLPDDHGPPSKDPGVGGPRRVEFKHRVTGEKRECVHTFRDRYVTILALSRTDLIDCFRRAN